jgi:hypothetical protein
MFLLISREDWNRTCQMLRQALAQLDELRHRLDERDREARDFEKQLLLVLVAGLFVLAAAIVTAVL